MKIILVLFTSFLLSAAASAAVESYKIDPAHSSVNFSIKHILGKVPGTFVKINGHVTVDRDDLTKSVVEATVDVASVNTNNEKRDHHLRTADFFDVEKFPTATFKSTAWTKTGEDTYDVTGDLTIKGTTRPVVFHVTSLGFGPGMKGAMLSGWEATTKFNKSDFGVNGPANLLNKGVGNEVVLTIDVEAVQQKT